MSHKSKTCLYTVLTIGLLACLWVGWRDFDPRIPQDEVRENIQSAVRWTLQLLIQYVIPAAIIVYFGKEAYAA
ncbi:MAG: hypothetical protein WD081_03600 [Gammaproteobacteria bacterium]